MADFIAGESVVPGATDGSKPGLPVRWKDMGDGTFAQVVSTSGGGGGGGGAVTLAAASVASGAYVAGSMVDGSLVTLGLKADSAATDSTSAWTLIALGKGLWAKLAAILTQLTTNVVVSATAGTTASSTAYEASHVGKASAGTLFAVSIYNSSTSAQFYQLHDAASLPANTAVPKSVIRIPAQGSGGWDFGLRGRPFATGIVITNSSTGPTLTVGSADSYYDAVVA